MENKSGVYPRGNRVLIYPDPIREKVTDRLIELPDNVQEKYASAQASGTVVEVGPDAWCHILEKIYRIIDNQMRLVEIRKRGYAQPFAVVGERISFAKYAGQKFTGKDGKRYLVINDEDVTTGLDEEVEISDLDVRKRVGERDE